MINFNGTITQQTLVNIDENRGFLYGDAVFETIKVLDNKVLFAEDHYFRLMSSMRILRMEIPLQLTLEFFETEILKTVMANNFTNARVRFNVYRENGGKYLPQTREVSFFISSEFDQAIYQNKDEKYEVELFKDFYISKHLLSNIKTTNCLINTTASIFAQENNYENCLLINDDKNIVEAINGNVFLVKDNVIITPPITDGCKKGIIRSKIIDIIKKNENYQFEERSISPFELQKADELFITNVIIGVRSISQYRKKSFVNYVANDLLVKLNAQIRFNS